MDLAKRHVADVGGHSYYAVDAFALRSRSLADEEFSNVATHQDLPAVPAGEVWLDDRLEPEFPFLIAEAAERLRLLAKGTDATHAYEGGLAVARSLREKARGHHHLGRQYAGPADPGVYTGRDFDFKGYRVRFVDGSKVRDLYKTDFSQGGNHEEYPFVPEGELWVETAVAPPEVPLVVEHEYHETELMKRGHSYETAHPAASRHEWRFRSPGGPRKYAGNADVDGVHRLLSTVPDRREPGGPTDYGAWQVFSDALRDQGKDAAADLATLISKPTYTSPRSRSNLPPRPFYDPDRTTDWEAADDGTAELRIAGVPIYVTRYRPWIYGDGGQLEPHPSRPEFFEAVVGRHPDAFRAGPRTAFRGRIGTAIIPAEHVGRLMDEADSFEGQIPYWHDVEESRMGRTNRPKEPRMPDPERYARQPQDLFARILAHPGARKFGLTREVLAAMPPEAVRDMARQLQIDAGEAPAAGPGVPAGGPSSRRPQRPPALPSRPAEPPPLPTRPRPLAPGTHVRGPIVVPPKPKPQPAAPEKPIPLAPVGAKVFDIRHDPESGLHLPVAERLRRAGRPRRFATLAGIPGEEALFPHERERIESFRPETEREYKTLIQRSMEDRPSAPAAGMPKMGEIRALARAGESARGGYQMGADIARHLFGHDDEAPIAWAGANSIFSAQTDVPQHTGAATVTVARWLEAGKPTERRAIRAILDSVGGTTDRNGNAVGGIRRPNGKLAYPTVRHPDRARKVIELLSGMGEFARSHEALARAVAGSGIGKTPNFALAFLSSLGIPIDAHMLRAVTPEGLHRTSYGRDLIRHVVDQAGLGPMSQAESREHYNSDLMRAIAEHGGVRAMTLLKKFNEDMMEKPQFFLAYKSLLGQAAKEFGWEPREMQEAVWTGVLAVMALRDLGVPPERMARAMRHDANLQGWNPITAIFQPEVINELVQSGVRRRDIDRVKQTFEQARAAGPTGRVFTGPSPALANVARRITPSYGTSRSVDPVRTAYEVLTGGGRTLTSLTGRRMARDGQPIRYRAVYQPHPALSPDHRELLNKTYAKFKLHPNRKTLGAHAAAIDEAIAHLGAEGSPGTMRQQQHLIRQLHRSKAFLGSLALAMKLERDGEPVRYMEDDEEEEPREYKPGEYVSDREGHFHPEQEPDLAEYIRNRFAADYGLSQPGDPVTRSTGYILPDGTPVNMGDDHTRHEDHRAALPFSSAMERWGWPEEVVRKVREGNRGPALHELMRRSGAIRFMPEVPMAHSEKPWTEAQKRAIGRYLDRTGEENIELNHMGHTASVSPHEIDEFLRKPRRGKPVRYAGELNVPPYFQRTQNGKSWFAVEHKPELFDQDPDNAFRIYNHPDQLRKGLRGYSSPVGSPHDVLAQSLWHRVDRASPDYRAAVKRLAQSGQPHLDVPVTEGMLKPEAARPAGLTPVLPREAVAGGMFRLGHDKMGRIGETHFFPAGYLPKAPAGGGPERMSRRRYAGHVAHPDIHAFLRAIAENPADIQPRLVFADWLDEHEMPHAAEMFRNPKPNPNPVPESGPRRGHMIGVLSSKHFKTGTYPDAIVVGAAGHASNFHGYGSYAPHVEFSIHHFTRPRDEQEILLHHETDPARALAIARELQMRGIIDHEEPREHDRATPEDMVRDVFGVDPAKLQRPGKPRRYAQPKPAQSFAQALRTLASPNVSAFADAVKSSYDASGVQGEAVPIIHDTPENSRPSILGLLRGKLDPKQMLYAAAWHGIMSKSPAMEAFVAGDGPDSLLSIAMPGSAGYAREVLNHIGVSPRLIRPDENFNEVLVMDHGGQLKDRITQLGLPVRELTGKSVRLRGMEDYRAIAREFEAQPRDTNATSQPAGRSGSRDRVGAGANAGSNGPAAAATPTATAGPAAAAPAQGPAVAEPAGGGALARR